MEPAIVLSDYRILLLDDEIETAKTVILPLQKRGFSITAVASAEEAFDLLERETVAVMVSDERMPKTSGVQFLTDLAIRYPRIVRVLFTAFADPDTAIAAINRGNIFRFVSKSEPIEKIAHSLEEAVYHYANAQFALEKIARDRNRDKAEVALTILRDVRYDWGNILLTQQLNFKKLKELLQSNEKRFGFDLTELIGRCEAANDSVERSLAEYFRNSFLDSTLTHHEAFVEATLTLPVQLAVNTILQKIDPTKIKLQFEYDKTHVYPAKIQRERLKAAVGLVVHNAVESIADKGTITVTLRKSSPQFFEITVADTGTGIAPEIRDKIFEPLFKTGDKQGHMGIGLTFVKAILEDHGGNVTFQSELGKGSVFTLRIPKK